MNRPLALALSFAWCAVSTASAQSLRGPLVSKATALHHGLERAWFTQVELDRSRGRIAGAALGEGVLVVLTEQGMVHSLDSETGRTLWVEQVGQPKHPSLGPAVSAEYVAVLNGSRLYILDRKTGQLSWERQVGSGPGAGPALGKDNVFVPLVNGRLEGYPVEHSARPPWIYSSKGRALVAPVVTDDSVAWPTDAGHFCVGRSTQPAIRFRVETNDSITSPPAYRRPYFYAASRDGYVYAVHELSGNQQWRFSAGDPISEPPAVIEDRLYVSPDRAGMFCVETARGAAVWWTPAVSRFLAAGKQRLIGTDKIGRLFILDKATGARLGVIRTPELSFTLINQLTDRVYVGSETGLIQCLHEADQKTPIIYAQPSPETETDKPKPKPTPSDDEATEEAGEDAATEDAGDAGDAGEDAAMDDADAEAGDAAMADEDADAGGDDEPFE